MPQFALGTEGKVTCRVDASYESRVTQINWFRNGARIHSNDKYTVSKNGELSIANIQKDDAGKYVCRVYVGQTQTGKIVNIKVEGKTNEFNQDETKSKSLSERSVIFYLRYRSNGAWSKRSKKGGTKRD